jgi:hypothetical protein
MPSERSMMSCRMLADGAWDRLARPRCSRRSRLRNELLKITKELRLKAWHTMGMMATLLVLDNFKIWVGRQQTDGVFVAKSRSKPFFASNELCRAQEWSSS